MEKPEVIIDYRDKKNSSGKVFEGKLYLSISNRLSKKEQQEHIRILTDKLFKKLLWAQNIPFYENRGPVQTDEDLWKLVNTINQRYYQVPLEKAVFHKQNSTWGTCSLKSRCIYLSHRLKNAPLDLIWYVIAHELSHMKEPSHNKRFWSIVEKACPNYKGIKKLLNAYGLQLNFE